VLHTSLDYRLHRHGLRQCGYLDFKPGQLRDRLPEPGPVDKPGPVEEPGPRVSEQSR